MRDKYRHEESRRGTAKRAPTRCRRGTYGQRGAMAARPCAVRRTAARYDARDQARGNLARTHNGREQGHARAKSASASTHSTRNDWDRAWTNYGQGQGHAEAVCPQCKRPAHWARYMTLSAITNESKQPTHTSTATGACIGSTIASRRGRRADGRRHALGGRRELNAVTLTTPRRWSHSRGVRDSYG